MRRVLLICALLAGCASPVVAPHVQSGPPSQPGFTLPNKTLTPGAAVPISLQTLCSTSTVTRRDVTAATKAKVYARYGLPVEHGAWEIDHLIPLELGGANTLANLWPERGVRPNPKDHLENRLHALVCAHKVALNIAQREIATNWVAAYREYMP